MCSGYLKTSSKRGGFIPIRRRMGMCSGLPENLPFSVSVLRLYSLAFSWAFLSNTRCRTDFSLRHPRNAGHSWLGLSVRASTELACANARLSCLTPNGAEAVLRSPRTYGLCRTPRHSTLRPTLTLGPRWAVGVARTSVIVPRRKQGHSWLWLDVRATTVLVRV